MRTFSEKLREARVTKGLTLEKLSSTTKISIKVLKAVETGDFELLPQTYIKGFIRSYAQEVGLDPAEITREYEHHLKATAAVFSQTKNGEKKSSRRIPWHIVGIVFVFFTLLCVLFVMVQKKGEERQPITPAETIEETVTAGSLGFLDTTETDTFALVQHEETFSPQDTSIEADVSEQGRPETSSIVEEDRLTLKAMAVSDTWVQVLADGNSIYEGIMKVGSFAAWEADSLFELKIGKANGIQLTFNDKPLGELGDTENVVRRLVLDRNGIVEKILR